MRIALNATGFVVECCRRNPLMAILVWWWFPQPIWIAYGLGIGAAVAWEVFEARDRRIIERQIYQLFGLPPDAPKQLSD